MHRIRRALVPLGLATLLALVLVALDTHVGARSELGSRAVASEPGQPQIPGTSVTADKTFVSGALGREMAYTLYLPPGYESSSNMRYPVLYMLHGMGNNNHQWADYGLLAEADHLISTGQITPMIIVMPNGGRDYWMDHADGTGRYGSAIADDLVQLIDRTYRTQTDRDARAIGGNSMGGHGAFQLALNHIDEFSIVGGHSMALRELAIAFPFFGDQSAYGQRDPITLARMHPEAARRLTIWIDFGANDQWEPRARAFHDQLLSEQVPHQWTLWPGAHTAEYWTTHVDDYLRYYDSAFRAHGATATALPDGVTSY